MLSYCQKSKKHGHIRKVTRLRNMSVGKKFVGQLFGGRVFSPYTFIFNLDTPPSRKGLILYFKELPRMQKISSVMNFADIITDALFAKLVYDIYPCIGIISGTSFVVTLGVLPMAYLTDYMAFMRNFSLEDRALNRLRWEVLIITPIEDLVHIILALYLFSSNASDYITYLCTMFSITMVLMRLFRVVIANKGGLQTVRGKTCDLGAGIEMQQVNNIETSVDLTPVSSPQTHQNSSDLLSISDYESRWSPDTVIRTPDLSQKLSAMWSPDVEDITVGTLGETHDASECSHDKNQDKVRSAI